MLKISRSGAILLLSSFELIRMQYSQFNVSEVSGHIGSGHGANNTGDNYYYHVMSVPDPDAKNS